MGGILSYPETRPRDSGLFEDLVWVDCIELVLELVLDLLMFFLEVL
jgi:hypothetical protein